MPEEIRPFVVYRKLGEQVECAVWRLADGQPALALFVSDQTATNYLTIAQLDAQWQVYQPEKPALLELIKVCRAGGIDYAVLDPDGEQATRIFDLQEISESGETQA